MIRYKEREFNVERKITLNVNSTRIIEEVIGLRQKRVASRCFLAAARLLLQLMLKQEKP